MYANQNALLRVVKILTITEFMNQNGMYRKFRLSEISFKFEEGNNVIAIALDGTVEMILKKKEEAGKFFETFFTGNKFQAIYTLKTRKIPYWVSIEAVEENNKTTKYVVLERI